MLFTNNWSRFFFNSQHDVFSPFLSFYNINLVFKEFPLFIFVSVFDTFLIYPRYLWLNERGKISYVTAFYILWKSSQKYLSQVWDEGCHSKKWGDTSKIAFGSKWVWDDTFNDVHHTLWMKCHSLKKLVFFERFFLFVIRFSYILKLYLSIST